MTKPSAISALHERDKVPKEELELATTLVNTLATPVDISSFRNKQREEILKIVDLKKQGKAISPTVIQEVAPTESDAMLESLRKSIEIVQKR